MSYLPDNPSEQAISDALAHTRNKIIAVDATRPSVPLRALRRLQRWCAAKEHRLLVQSHPRVVVSEQVIENALILANVGVAEDILDFGGFESTLPLTLAALGKRVTVLDQRQYPFAVQNLTPLRDDVLQPLHSLEDRFDLVYSISTVEHVGLGGYGSATATDGDRRALVNLWNTVRRGGRLLFTVPAGKRAIRRGYRVYDGASLDRIIPAPAEARYFMKPGRYATWREVSGAEIETHVYDAYNARTPVEGVAFVSIVKS